MPEDLKYAVRTLTRAPGFSALAVLTLAFAIGANTAVFSVADAVLFRPLPYRAADEVLIVQMSDRAGARYTNVPIEQIDAIERNHRGLGTVARLEQGPTVIGQGETGARFVPTVAVSDNYFDVLGVQPSLGRLFSAGTREIGRPAVLSYQVWRAQFGGNPSVIG